MLDRVAIAALCIALVAGLQAGAVVGAGSAAVSDRNGEAAGIVGQATADQAEPSATGETITETMTVRLVPNKPGIFEATVEYEIPSQVTEFEVILPDGATVTSTSGFEQAKKGPYEWVGRNEPSLTFRSPTNETARSSSPDRLRDVGSWALVRPTHRLSWRYQGTPPAFERDIRADGEGVAGSTYAFLGPHEEYVGEGHQTIRLVVPETAEYIPEVEESLDLLTYVSRDLEVGGGRDEVRMFVAPREAGTWPATGWTPDGEDLVLPERQSDYPETWIHEYLHSRQDWERTDETAWLVEGTANYYDQLYAMQLGALEFDDFAGTLTGGELYRDGVLAKRSSWEDSDGPGNGADYRRGALVVGTLDMEIRLATDGERTFADVFARFNERSGPLTHEDVLDALESVGGADVRDLGERYVETEAVPEMWNEPAHRDAFGTVEGGATVEALSVETDGDGAVFDVTLGTDGRPTQETDDVIVENDRGTPVSYVAVELYLRQGETVRIEEQFELEPGTYTVRVADREERFEIPESTDGDEAAADGLAAPSAFAAALAVALAAVLSVKRRRERDD